MNEPAASTPPPIPSVSSRRDPLARSVTLARVSGGSMLVLGCVSALATVLHPVSVAFLISVLVVGNGWIEWHWGGRLRLRDLRAPMALALNQSVLAVELVAYAAWQYFAVGPEAIRELLVRPLVSSFLGVVSADEVMILVEMLVPMIRLLYACVAVVAVVGCGGMAWYYRSRARHLRPLSRVASANS